LPPVMAGLGSSLVATSPGGPVEPVGHVVHGLDDKHREQALDLVASERDQPGARPVRPRASRYRIRICRRFHA
jgi:hypothetical protein